MPVVRVTPFLCLLFLLLHADIAADVAVTAYQRADDSNFEALYQATWSV